jgi:hypothetical protein
MDKREYLYMVLMIPAAIQLAKAIAAWGGA